MISPGDYFRRLGPNQIVKQIVNMLLSSLLVMVFCPAATDAKDLPKPSKPNSLSKSVKTALAPKKASLPKLPGTAIQHSTSKPSVLEFGAAWCVPCKVFAPIFEKVKNTYSDKVDFHTYDTETPEGEKLSDKFAVSGLPTVIILDSSSKVFFRKSGIMDEKTLTAEVIKAIGK